MNLSIKQKALLQTTTVLGIGALVGTTVSLSVSYFGLMPVLVAFAVMLVLYTLYTLYQINLSQLQYKETLNKMVDKK